MTKKLNIAMVAACPFPANRGTPSRILRMAEAVSELGHGVFVVTYHFGTDTTTNLDIQRIPRVPYENFSPGPTMTKLAILDPLLFAKLLRVVRSKKIDLIHAHHFEGALIGYMVRKLTGIKVIYDAHTTLEGELASYSFIRMKVLEQFLDKNVPKWADHVIAVSETLEAFFRGNGVENVDVIPTGVNSDHFEGADQNAIRDRYKLNGKLIVMYTGSMASFQGVEYLIEAMRRVFEKRQDVVLFLVTNSSAESYEKIFSKKDIADRIIIASDQPYHDVPLFLASADVVVNPRIECPGMPQKLTNYMAARKAIVSFEGSAKLLENNVNGLVVENGNTAAMADSIITLLENREYREKLGENARSAVIGRYDWKILCQRIEEIYFKLLGL